MRAHKADYSIADMSVKPGSSDLRSVSIIIGALFLQTLVQGAWWQSLSLIYRSFTMKGAQTVVTWVGEDSALTRGKAWLGLPYAEHKDAVVSAWFVGAQPGEAASDGAQCCCLPAVSMK